MSAAQSAMHQPAQASPNQTASLGIKIGILSMIMIGYSSSSVGVGLGGMAEDFPNIPETTLMLVNTVVAFTSMLASFSSSFFQRFLSQKQVLMLACVLLLIGVIPFVFHSNFYFVLSIVGVLGFGSGLITSTAPAFISAHFKGEERTKMLGMKMSVQGVGSVVFSLLGGALAAIGWYFAYTTFSLCGIALIVGALFMPHEKPQHRVIAGKDAEGEVPAEEGNGTLRLTQPMAFLPIVFTTLMCSAITAGNGGLALHIANYDIGSPAFVGIVGAVLSAGMVVGGIIAPKLIALLKCQMLNVAFLCFAIGMAMLGFSREPIMCLVAALLLGTMYSALFTTNLNHVSKLVRPASQPLAMSLVSGVSSLGATLAIPAANAVAGFYPVSASTANMFTGALACLAVSVVAFVTRYERRALKLEEQQQGL